MAVSKRLRYEILRRDNFTCRYCGFGGSATAPLVIDHVTPKTLGGTDDPANLVASCEPCNSGKSATPPGAPLVADVAQEDLRWAAAIRRAALIMSGDVEDRNAFHEMFSDAWNGGTNPTYEIPRPADWRNTIDGFLQAGLTLSIMEEAIRISMSNRKVYTNQVWRYFCGICWRKVAELQERTKAILAAEDGDG